MSLNKQNFPTGGQGDRRVEDVQRIPKGVTIAAPGSQLNVGHVAHAYQAQRTLTRLAPAGTPALTGVQTRPVIAHQIANLNTTGQKKEGLRQPLSTASVTSVHSGAVLSNIIPVQLNASSVSSASSTLHVPNVSSIVRGAIPGALAATQYTHLPRGGVAASAVRPGSVQRQPLVNTMQTTALNLQGAIRNVIQPVGMRPNTPPTNRPASPAISLGTTGQPLDAHRANISLQNVSTTSIQITLQPSRTVSDPLGKAPTTFQTGKVAGVTITSQPPKVVLTQPYPVLQHQTLAAKGNRGQPITAQTVTLATTMATVTIPSLASTTPTTIPIAKVPPQRQIQTGSGHMIQTSVTMPSSHAEHRSEAGSFPQPQSAHAHPMSTAPNSTHTTSQSAVVSQASSLFMQYRAPTTNSSVPANSVTHAETRGSSMPMPFLPPLMLSPDNPYYQQLMRCQVAAVAQAQARPSLPSLRETTATLQANLHAGGQTGVPQATTAGVRLNQMMVMQDSVRPTAPQVATQHAPIQQLQASSADVKAVTTSTLPTAITTAISAISAMHTNPTHGIGAMAAVASSLFTAAQQLGHTSASHMPQHMAQSVGSHMGHTTQVGQILQQTGPSSTPITNPNASPRPSILRKRTNEGVSAVKKQLALTSEVHSPRPEMRPDSTPQSNMSSPKTPASGVVKMDHPRGPRESPFSESQSSTDTALSSEATTPTQPHSEHRIKHEHDIQENGFGNSTPEASPRKRRKQLLQASEEIKDTPVNVFDKLVEACVKQESLDDAEAMLEEEDEDDDDLDDEVLDRMDMREEYVDDEGVRWTLEKCRPNLALLNFYNISWKPKLNHFNRYTDVKPKDERRPTVNEMSNQKGVVQKASGWKLYHMAAQIEDLVELERELNSTLSELQMAIGPEPPLKHAALMEDEPGIIHELTQGNIQRCKLLTDQLNEAKTQMLKVLEHKPKISEIVSKHLSKRPIKKKERT
ncbi:histone deacetylase complex subunit SAP130-A-like isoform X2 [Mya arenaria]|uniref:histone deacetylase complex subunit SAP130-A-like isoform X2 n=1 Tax=Mya arenaria TaxID=6604 RepID=UPI0022E7E42D|nr:histone deacetylase complex subunit SAP130-A-like isoform X2 [Mya arenaria]